MLNQPIGWEEVELWEDAELRSGPENMAVDEWLLGIVVRPLLRVYGWLGDWVSLGCFARHEDARAHFARSNPPQFVRRWTGGGIVDHRGDWTYTLVVPAPFVAGLGRPRESYLRVHEALARALQAEQIGTEVGPGAGNREATGLGVCFENPVAGDILDVGGEKIAGAAQRRTRRGLLHQGSVRAATAGSGAEDRGRRFAAGLATVVIPCCLEPDRSAIGHLVEARYGLPEWLRRC